MCLAECHKYLRVPRRLRDDILHLSSEPFWCFCIVDSTTVRFCIIKQYHKAFYKHLSDIDLDRCLAGCHKNLRIPRRLCDDVLHLGVGAVLMLLH